MKLFLSRENWEDGSDISTKICGIQNIPKDKKEFNWCEREDVPFSRYFETSLTVKFKSAAQGEGIWGPNKKGSDTGAGFHLMWNIMNI